MPETSTWSPMPGLGVKLILHISVHLDQKANEWGEEYIFLYLAAVRVCDNVRNGQTTVCKYHPLFGNLCSSETISTTATAEECLRQCQGRSECLHWVWKQTKNILTKHWIDLVRKVRSWRVERKTVLCGGKVHDDIRGWVTFWTKIDYHRLLWV